MKLSCFRFPPEHYGKLTSLSLLMGVIFGSLQYPLSILTETQFGNNPFWVSPVLVVLLLTKESEIGLLSLDLVGCNRNLKEQFKSR